MRAMILACVLGVAGMFGASSVEAAPYHRNDGRVHRNYHRSYHVYHGRTFYWKTIRVPYFKTVLVTDVYGNTVPVLKKFYRFKQVRVFIHY